MTAARLNQLHVSMPAIANGSGENIMPSQPQQPVGSNDHYGRESSQEATSPAATSATRFIKLEADLPEDFKEGAMRNLMTFVSIAVCSLQVCTTSLTNLTGWMEGARWRQRTLPQGHRGQQHVCLLE